MNQKFFFGFIFLFSAISGAQDDSRTKNLLSSSEVELLSEQINNDLKYPQIENKKDSKTEVNLSEDKLSAVDKPVDLQDEKNVPLNLDLEKSKKSESSLVSRIIFSLLILSGLMLFGYLMLKKYRNPKNKSKLQQIKIISQFYLGPKKSLAIIHVAGESMLIGITDQNISMLKSLALIDDEIPSELPPNFEKTMQDQGANSLNQEALVAPQTVKVNSILPQDGEDFSISGIKDVVRFKLKNMRSL